jgi:hypothetical protein
MHALARRLIGSSLLAAALAMPGVSAAYKGRVVDGTTGQPIEGAYVIGRWEGGGGFVVSSSGCTLAIDKSNAKGEFELVSGTSFLGRLFGIRSQPFVFFYRPGYIEPERYPDGIEPWTLIPDRSSSYERIRHLIKVQGFIDCGGEEIKDHGEELKPIYRAMIIEGTSLAKSRDERIEALKLYFWLEFLELGPTVASERTRARFEQIRREP